MYPQVRSYVVSSGPGGFIQNDQGSVASGAALYSYMKTNVVCFLRYTTKGLPCKTIIIFQNILFGAGKG